MKEKISIFYDFVQKIFYYILFFFKSLREFIDQLFGKCYNFSEH